MTQQQTSRVPYSLTCGRIILEPVAESRLRLDAGTWGTMGVGLGAAIAAATARPDRLSVAVEGDSAFGFSGMELETICRCLTSPLPRTIPRLLEPELHQIGSIQTAGLQALLAAASAHLKAVGLRLARAALFSDKNVVETVRLATGQKLTCKQVCCGAVTAQQLQLRR